MTPCVTVIIPTFNHGPLLRLAVESVLRQTEPRLEVVIIGDGATPETRAAAELLTRTDNRIRFVGFEKDSNKGERYRSLVLEQAQGAIICYLSDDDLWTPDHVETMLDLLTGRDGGDFAMTLQVRPSPRNGALTLGPAGYVDLARPHHRRLCAQPTSGFANGLSCVAHTLDFYRSLPHGWQTTPAGLPTDGWMWRQCLSQPGVRARSRRRATAIHFHSPPRRYWPIERRLDEMARVATVLVRGGWDDDLRRLERRCARLPVTSRVWQFLWMQLHASPVTGLPAKQLASSIANRPVP
jgi:GalNAc5-diNAcBac-PP-undecaprenol beta-1,3-glucosyltransferase